MREYLPYKGENKGGPEDSEAARILLLPVSTPAVTLPAVMIDALPSIPRGDNGSLFDRVTPFHCMCQL
jgi:hypothetical protein